MRHASSLAPLAVVGAGAWGTVLAVLLARNGHRVRLWARRPELAERIATERENPDRLPGVRLPSAIEATGDLEHACSGAQAVFMVVPNRALEAVAAALPEVPAIVSCSKGLARPGLTRPSEIIARHKPGAAIAALSGPNLASEIAAGLPAAAVVASPDEGLADSAAAWLQSTRFRVYTSTDLAGVEVGGALKNVIALAAGMSDGLDLGENTKATILTRGLVEMVRLGIELGGRRETFYGLAGLGDMVATCSSRGSRNHAAGERLARGATREELSAEGLTAEGIPTVEAIHAHAAGLDISMPIAQEVYRVIFERKSPHEAIDALMARERRSEW